MKDPSKTNQELIAEISVLKQRIQNLEQLVLDHKKAEETIRASEAKYRLAFESTSDGIFTIDRNFNTSITPSVERQLGYKVEKMINKPIQDLNILTPESLTRAVSDVKTILSGVEVTGAVYEFIAKDGTRKIGEVTGTPIIQEGRILGTTAIVRDITARKKTEEALRESEERLRDIMFSIADWVWEVDENGVYTYSSQKGVDLLGKSREDIIGKTPFDFMPPDEAKRVAAIFSEIVANKAPIKDLENWNISRNGEKICLLTNGVPILDEEGNLKGYRGIDKDITEHKRADARLKQQTDAMDAANDGMALLNEEGKYVYINKAHVKVYGYENAEELIGKSWRMLYDSDVLQRFDQEIMPEFSRKGDWYGEAIGTKKNGGKFPQELSLTAMANGGLI